MRKNKGLIIMAQLADIYNRLMGLSDNMHGGSYRRCGLLAFVMGRRLFAVMTRGDADAGIPRGFL